MCSGAEAGAGTSLGIALSAPAPFLGSLRGEGMSPPLPKPPGHRCFSQGSSPSSCAAYVTPRGQLCTAGQRQPPGGCSCGFVPARCRAARLRVNRKSSSVAGNRGGRALQPAETKEGSWCESSALLPPPSKDVDCRAPPSPLTPLITKPWGEAGWSAPTRLESASPSLTCFFILFYFSPPQPILLH